MSTITIKQTTVTAAEYPQVWQLREKVLRKPLGLSLLDEDLSADAFDTIFIALDNDKVVGCVMLQQKGNNVIKLRQMAVAEEWQGKGIGKQLVETAEQHAWATGMEKIVLHARAVASVFYKKLDYITTGDTFTEVSVPHFLMEKNRP